MSLCKHYSIKNITGKTAKTLFYKGCRGMNCLKLAFSPGQTPKITENLTGPLVPDKSCGTFKMYIAVSTLESERQSANKG